MSDTVIPFDFEEHAVRVILRKGEPWFVAADVCRVLEIANRHDAVSRLDNDERDAVGTTDSVGRTQSMNIISESGLYALIFTSRKEQARMFRKWVTSEVLPSIRRQGRYFANTSSGLEPENGEPLNLDAVTAHTVDTWLRLVREARVLAGPAAGRAMWEVSCLPPLLAEGSAVAVVSNQQAQECLSVLAGFEIGNGQRLIDLWRTGEPTLQNKRMLATLGLRRSAVGFAVMTGPTSFAEQVFSGTVWGNGRWRTGLRAVPGAKPWPTVITFCGNRSRALDVPMEPTHEVVKRGL